MKTHPENHHNENTLPIWARTELNRLRSQVHDLQEENDRTKSSKEILQNREWFPIYGPVLEGDNLYKLWYFERNDPRVLCTLHPKDVLIIGRYRPDPEEKWS